VPDPVAPAQQDAIKAREDKERLSLEAQAYSNDILPKARGSAGRLVQDAQAYRAQKIANAEGESQRFSKLLPEYEKAPVVTRQRLYLETLEAVLANSKKILIDAKGTGNMIYLPLDKLLGEGRGTMAPGTARKPASRKRFSPQPSNFEGTLSHHDALPGPPAIWPMSLRRNDSSTAFFSH